MSFRVGENSWSVRMFQKDSPSTQKDIGSDIKVNNECLLKGLEIARDKAAPDLQHPKHPQSWKSQSVNVFSILA